MTKEQLNIEIEKQINWQAAMQALLIMRDASKENTATYFDVLDCADNKSYKIDLSKEKDSFYAQLHTGDQVWWTDPDDGLCSGYRHIITVDHKARTVSFDDGTEAYFDEIS